MKRILEHATPWLFSGSIIYAFVRIELWHLEQQQEAGWRRYKTCQTGLPENKAPCEATLFIALAQSTSPAWAQIRMEEYRARYQAEHQAERTKPPELA